MGEILLNLVLIFITYFGIYHYTGHHCIALASLGALFYTRIGQSFYK